MTTAFPITALVPHFDPDFKLMHGSSGAWQFYCYDQVQKILFDAGSFSNNYMPSDGDQLLGSNINQVDPPLHGRLRSLISGFFSKAAIEAGEPWIHEVAGSLLSPKTTSMEVASEFAFPLTTSVICRIIGVPEDYHSKVNGWAKAIVSAGYSEGGLLNAATAQKEMGQLFFALLEARTAAPQADLLSALANAEQSDDAFTLPVKIGTCMTLLLAGFETTANLLVSCIHTLTEIQGLQEELSADPGMVPTAILETLRLKPSLVSMYRRASSDMHFGGCHIRQGDMVNAWVCVANRDPDVFTDPHRFALDRPNLSKVLSFGYGIHHCIGAGLAKVQVRIALELLLARFKSIKLRQGAVLMPLNSQISYGLQALPITFNS